MSKIKEFVDLLLTRKFAFKFLAYFLLGIFLYLFSDFLGFFLLTFIFSYLFFSLWEFIQKYLYLFIDKFCKNKARVKLFKNIFSLNFIVVIQYVIFVTIIISMISSIVPKLIFELSELPKTLPFIAEYANQLNEKLVEIKNFNTQIGWGFEQIVTTKDLDIAVDIILKIKDFSFAFLQVFLSLVLSFIFILDRKKMFIYLQNIKKSSFNFLYKEYKIIFDKILKSFWLIFKAQATIAFVNALLTAIWLTIIWLVHWASFPYLLTLILIVFIAWFIPVLWTFISSIPIIFVWYSSLEFWGYGIVLEIILLISIIHTIEAYYLNPKIVSRFLDLPVSITFVVLILSEKLFWIAWLLVWISVFYFVVGLLRDIDKSIKKKKKAIKKINKDVS